MTYVLSWVMVARAGAAFAAVPTSVHAQGSDTATAFVNVAVIPMDSERVVKDQTVIVRGHQIIAFGRTRDVPVPAGAKTIDGQGKFLMPGLADMHAHVIGVDSTGTGWANSERVLYLYAAAGVTTIRNMGFFPPPDVILTLRARVAKGEIIGPRIYAAAGPVNHAADVDTAKAQGFDLVKLYGIDSTALDSIAMTARRLGIPIAGHAPSYMSSPHTLDRAIAVRYASIEHLTGFDTYLGTKRGGLWWEYWDDTTRSPDEPRQLVADTTKLHAIASAMQRAGVWNCPTLAMFDASSVGAAEWPELRYLTSQSATKSREKAETREQTWERVPARRATVQTAMEARYAIVRALRDAGAGLLLGTDSPVTFMLPGFGVHRELQALVRAGLTPYQALATGTRNVAGYFGTLDSTGTVAVGKRADLILLDGNPLQDIHNTMRLTGVMLAGRWLEREELDRGLKGIEGTIMSM